MESRWFLSLLGRPYDELSACDSSQAGQSLLRPCYNNVTGVWGYFVRLGWAGSAFGHYSAGGSMNMMGRQVCNGQSDVSSIL